MSITRSSKLARTSSAGNPISQAVTITELDGGIVVLLNVIGATTRAGGTPTFAGVNMRQANSTQRAAASPEASCEVWYLDVRDLLPWPAGSYTLVIPNTGALTIKLTVEGAQPLRGGKVAFDAAIGSNNTSTNPTCTALTVSEAGVVVWSIIAGGAQTWAPSAQSGTIIANTDDGATGGGEQFSSNPAIGSHTANWTFGTSEDWGAVAVALKEVPPKNINNYKKLGGSIVL